MPANLSYQCLFLVFFVSWRRRRKNCFFVTFLCNFPLIFDEFGAQKMRTRPPYNDEISLSSFFFRFGLLFWRLRRRFALLASFSGACGADLPSRSRFSAPAAPICPPAENPDLASLKTRNGLPGTRRTRQKKTILGVDSLSGNVPIAAIKRWKSFVQFTISFHADKLILLFTSRCVWDC